jgi:hypothetical protein
VNAHWPPHGLVKVVVVVVAPVSVVVLDIVDVVLTLVVLLGLVVGLIEVVGSPTTVVVVVVPTLEPGRVAIRNRWPAEALAIRRRGALR